MVLQDKRFRSICPLIQDQIPRLWFSFFHCSNRDNSPWKWWVGFVCFVMFGEFINFLLWNIFLSVAFCCLYPIFRMDCPRPRCTAVLIEALCITFEMYAPLSSASAEAMGITLWSRVNILSSLIEEGLWFKSSSSGLSSTIFRMVKWSISSVAFKGLKKE